jgi:hypothetical protein
MKQIPHQIMSSQVWHPSCFTHFIFIVMFLLGILKLFSFIGFFGHYYEQTQ